MLVSCGGGDAAKPAATKAKAEEKPEPITGRSAFYKMYPSARQWATDCKVIQIASIHLPGVPAEPGKAGAWRAVFTSDSKAMMKTFLWSAIDAEGGFRKGAWGGTEESFRGKVGQAFPFYPQALQHDSDAAYKEALTKDDPYLKKGEKASINFLLEYTPPRYPNAAWRVLWGETVGTANYSVFVDATTGKFLEKGR